MRERNLERSQRRENEEREAERWESRRRRHQCLGLGAELKLWRSWPASQSRCDSERAAVSLPQFFFFFLRSIKVHPNKTSDFEALTLAKRTQMQITDKNVTMAFNLKSSC